MASLFERMRTLTISLVRKSTSWCGDSSSSKAKRTLDVQIRQNESATSVNKDDTVCQGKMKLFTPSIQLGRPTMALDDQIDELDELIGAGDLEEKQYGLSSVGYWMDTPTEPSPPAW